MGRNEREEESWLGRQGRYAGWIYHILGERRESNFSALPTKIPQGGVKLSGAVKTR